MFRILQYHYVKSFIVTLSALLLLMYVLRNHFLSSEQMTIAISIEKLEKKFDIFISQYKLTILPTFMPVFSARNINWQNLEGSKNESYRRIFGNKSHITSLVTYTTCQRSYALLILVTSHLSHFDRRNTIRSTWGKDLKKESPRWKAFFLIGKSNITEEHSSILNEFSIYDDLVLADTYENFYNLTYKVQMGFEWSLRYCHFNYLLKSDDDVFVNVPQLFKFLNKTDTPKTELYAGNVNFVADVLRTGRYGVSKKQYRKKVYPRYCSGGGFVLSRDTVERFIENFASVPFMTIDDAYIGELALKSGIDIYHADNFNMYENPNSCKFKKHAIIHHPVKNGKCMENLYKNTLSALIQLK